MKAIVFIISFLLLLQTSVFSNEDEDVLKVTGWVLDGKGDVIRNANILVYKNDKKTRELRVSNDGKFTASLKLDTSYTIKVTAPDKINKIFFVDSSVPEDQTNRHYNFEFIIELFPVFRGTDLSLFEKPLATIYYSPSKEKFFYDEEEYKPIAEKVESTQNHVLKLIEKKDVYDDKITKADSLYNNHQLEKALEYYAKAEKLDLPGSTSGLEQIVNVSQELGIPVEDDLQYKMLITTADQKYEKEQLEKAIKKYQKALDIKPGESYPLERIEDSEKLLAKKQLAKTEIPATDDEQHDEPGTPTITMEQMIEEKTISFQLKDIPGATDEIFTFKAKQIKQINNIAETLRKNPNARLIIHSYASGTNNKEQDFYLSKKQANAIINKMTNTGVEKNKLHPVFHIDDQNNNKQQNKRIYSKFEVKYEPDFRKLVNNSHKHSLRLLDNLEQDAAFSPEAEFLVQFIAIKYPVKPQYYEAIINQLPGKNIYYYYSNKKLHHYSIGSMSSISQAMDVHRKLRSLGYETYIIVLKDGNRVLTSEIN